MIFDGARLASIAIHQVPGASFVHVSHCLTPVIGCLPTPDTCVPALDFTCCLQVPGTPLSISHVTALLIVLYCICGRQGRRYLS